MGNSSTLLALLAVCVDCGGAVSKVGVQRCIECHLKHIAIPNINKICPKCGGPKAWEAAACSNCRWGNFEYASRCEDCGTPIQSKSKKCIECMRRAAGYQVDLPAKDHVCRYPGCEDLVGPKGGRGKCGKHLQSMRHRLAVLESDRPHKVALFRVDPHSFKEFRCVLPDQYAINRVRRKLLKKQGGICKLCLTDQTGQWDLDHDRSCTHHSKKKMCGCCVRGVLCATCNRNIHERFGDLEYIKRLFEYLGHKLGE